MITTATTKLGSAHHGHSSTSISSGLMARRPGAAWAWLPGTDQAVDRQHPGSAHEDRQRHGDQRQIHLPAVPLSRLEAPVEEKAVWPVHLGDRDQHDDDE